MKIIFTDIDNPEGVLAKPKPANIIDTENGKKIRIYP
jgi:hypothetical protein